MRESDESVHQSELPGMIKPEPGDAFSGWSNSGLCELPQLAAIDEGLKDILLNVEIIVVDGRHGRTKCR